MSQPSTGSLDRHETDRILARASVPIDVIQRGMATGAKLDLETVVQALLADHDGPT
jgi:hypothetical protein